MTDFTALLKKIEEADRSSYVLEMAIAKASGWECGIDPQPLAYTASMDAIVSLIERKLPGWWYTTGDCALTSHASIGPDRTGPDADLLELKKFDAGFHADLTQPSTPALALAHVFLQALQAKAEVAA